MNERKFIAIGVDREGQMWGDHFGESPAGILIAIVSRQLVICGRVPSSRNPFTSNH